MEKVNYPKSTLFYVNEAHLTVEKNENIIYADHSIIGEIIPAANVPSDVENYECGPEEFKVILPVFGINWYCSKKTHSNCFFRNVFQQPQK